MPSTTRGSTSALPAAPGGLGKGRKRSGSVQEALAVFPDSIPASNPPSPLIPNQAGSLERMAAEIAKKEKLREGNEEGGFLSDLVSWKWMTNPASSAKLILLIGSAYSLWELYHHSIPTPSPSSVSPNPFAALLFISYPLLPSLAPDGTIPKDGTTTNAGGIRYDKGPQDALFLAFYIIVFSFLRQAITEFGVRPLAVKLGVRGESKLKRFMEQGYALCYFLASASLGLYVMSTQKTWWYQTEHYWIDYPHWRMTGALKSYYLLQFAYWCQQMLVLVLQIEKPRSDFFELVIHHLVTLWLVGWSYTLNFTMIGTAVFVSMDIPDVCLAFSKCLNYLDLQRTSEVSFVFFLVVWHYMRHYLNIKILLSVYNEFDLYVPKELMTWTGGPERPGLWWLPFGVSSGLLPTWIKDQIFLPILLLQLVNLFWSFLIWRVLFRMIFGPGLVDSREEGEDGEIDSSSSAVVNGVKMEGKTEGENGMGKGKEGRNGKKIKSR